MPDRYASWSELTKEHTLGTDFSLTVEVRAGARWLVAAPHGGGIEPGTTEIARAIADQDLSFYSAEGTKRTGNKALHITSHRFDEPSFDEAAGRHEAVATIHGCDESERDQDVSVWVGGADDALIDRAIEFFSAAKYSASRDRFTPGTEPRNVCNRGRSGRGLQFELSESLRRHFFRDLTRPGRSHPTSELERFAHVVREILKAGPERFAGWRAGHASRS